MIPNVFTWLFLYDDDDGFAFWFSRFDVFDDDDDEEEDTNLVVLLPLLIEAKHAVLLYVSNEIGFKLLLLIMLCLR